MIELFGERPTSVCQNCEKLKQPTTKRVEEPKRSCITCVYNKAKAHHNIDIPCSVCRDYHLWKQDGYVNQNRLKKNNRTHRELKRAKE